MQTSLSVPTSSSCQFVDITAQIQQELAEAGLTDGIVVAYVAHTTAGITINENADPDVTRDILMHLDKLVPTSREFRHSEGNSDAHIKASLMGSSVTVIVSAGRLMLGTWQGIYFCEFDGPRSRKVWLKILKD
jgi:secondary thiamine-phosphate synthase enzyme